MTVYVPETFTDEEAEVLRRYFTNLDGPVFALVNLPEVVKGALFARYSRSPKSLRRLFLDEFLRGDHVAAPAAGEVADAARRRAEPPHERVFVEYGDDSVAQLRGGHRVQRRHLRHRPGLRTAPAADARASLGRGA